jgi:hypothetical protein
MHCCPIERGRSCGLGQVSPLQTLHLLLKRRGATLVDLTMAGEGPGNDQSSLDADRPIADPGLHGHGRASQGQDHRARRERRFRPGLLSAWPGQEGPVLVGRPRTRGCGSSAENRREPPKKASRPFLGAGTCVAGSPPAVASTGSRAGRCEEPPSLPSPTGLEALRWRGFFRRLDVLKIAAVVSSRRLAGSDRLARA